MTGGRNGDLVKEDIESEEDGDLTDNSPQGKVVRSISTTDTDTDILGPVGPFIGANSVRLPNGGARSHPAIVFFVTTPYYW